MKYSSSFAKYMVLWDGFVCFHCQSVNYPKSFFCFTKETNTIINVVEA